MILISTPLSWFPPEILSLTCVRGEFGKISRKGHLRSEYFVRAHFMRKWQGYDPRINKDWSVVEWFHLIKRKQGVRETPFLYFDWTIKIIKTNSKKYQKNINWKLNQLFFCSKVLQISFAVSTARVDMKSQINWKIIAEWSLIL